MTRVLVVDDSAAQRLLVRRWLESSPSGPFEVAEASDAEEGFRRAAADRPDCVLVDHIMLGASGFQAVHRMRAEIPDCPPIILLTGVPSEELRRNALALGAAACYDKASLDAAGLARAVLAATSAARPESTEETPP